jgi:hypothetical protein
MDGFGKSNTPLDKNTSKKDQPLLQKYRSQRHKPNPQKPKNNDC